MNKITAAKWNEAYKALEKETVTDWNGSELHIKKNISYTATAQFVSEVANVCFDASGDYRPENFDFAFRAATVMHYSNVTVPSDGEKAYMLLYATDIYDILCASVNHAQLDRIREAAECRIGYLIDTRTNALASALSDLRTMMNGIAEKVKAATESIGEIDEEHVKRFVEAVGELGKLDEGKLVDALSERGMLSHE